MILTKPVDTEVISDMVMTEIHDDSEPSEMIMTKPVETEYESDMAMVKPNEANEIVSAPMVKPVHTEYNSDMPMVKPNKANEIVNAPMVKPIPSEALAHAPMIKPNDSKPISHAPMVSNNSDITPVTKMEMTKPNESEAPTYMDMVTNDIEAEQKAPMKMVNITDAPKLIQKIEALTSINVDELKTIGTEDMLSLADIIESTYTELKSRMDNIKMQSNKPNIPKHHHMKMTAIKQPERNTYLSNKFLKVDAAAMNRALQAKKNAIADRSDGNSGNAI